MKRVICPIDNEPIGVEYCLKCALTFENLCGYDYGILKAMFDKVDQPGIHVTDLTGCLRKAYYSKTIEVPVPLYSLLSCFPEAAIHAAFEQSCDHTSDCYPPLKADGIFGKPDRFYKDGILVDYRTIREMIPSKLPYSPHALQLQYYIHMLREMKVPVMRAFIQYIDLSGPTRCTYGPRGHKCNAIVEYRDGKYACPKCLREFPEGHLGACRVEINTHEDIQQVLFLFKDMLASAIEEGNPPLPEPSNLCNNCEYKGNICDPLGTRR